MVVYTQTILCIQGYLGVRSPLKTFDTFGLKSI